MAVYFELEQNQVLGQLLWTAPGSIADLQNGYCAYSTLLL